MTRPTWIASLLAAAATAALSADAAFAQYRVDRSGATDANTRVGSGGRNEGGNNPRPWEIANSIVEGTISGGKGFRGGTQSFDPRAFRGQTAGAPSANLVRDASGVNTSGQTSYNANRSTQFYGDNLAVAPPPGFRSVGYTPGYIPPRLPSYLASDPRLAAAVPPTGTLSTPRPFDTGGTDPLSNLPGLGELGDQRLEPLTLSNYTALDRSARTGVIDSRNLQQLRNGILQADDAAANPLDPNAPAGGTNNGNPNNNGANGNGTNGAGSNDPNRVDASVGSGAALDSQSIKNTLGTGDARVNAAVGGPDAPVPGQRNRLLVPPEQQSSVYETLKRTRSQFEQTIGGDQPGSDAVRANREYNESRRALTEAEEKARKTDSPTPGNRNNNPGGANGAAGNNAGGVNAGNGNDAAGATRPPIGIPGNVNTNATPKPDQGPALPTPVAGEPVKVDSLATGVKSKGLADLLTKAETQVRDGKYMTAMDTYDAASQVAPNNGLIRLGRVHAEFAAGYYSRAERGLRQILSADKNLLAGQYDLRVFLGQDRLVFLDKELKDLVRANPKDAGAPLLLAYLYYNTGDVARAKSFLALAQERANGQDAFVKTLQQSWFLPRTDANATPDAAANEMK